MIRLEHIGKEYDGMDAVKDLSLSIQEGEICVLLGPSGCGKSTTLRMINKLIPASSGKIFINNKEINEYPVEELRKGIGYVVQSTGLFPHMNVEENISVVPKLLKWEKERITKKVDEMLELVGLDSAVFRKKYPQELSGGEAQRIGVARALAADPPIILMDEPFGAVDPLNRKRLQAEFLKIQKELKKTIVFVTHDVEEAIRMGNKIAIMNKGMLEAYDTPQGLIMKNENKFVKEFLGGEYAIKLLSKYTLKDVLEKTDEIVQEASMSGETNLQEAMSYMIENGFMQINVTQGEDGIGGKVTIERIVNVLKKTCEE